MVHSFTLVVVGIDLVSPDSPAPDALYEAGCDDAMLTSHGAEQQIVFDRDASTFAVAVASAITAVETALPGALVIRVDRLPPAELPPRQPV